MPANKNVKRISVYIPKDDYTVIKEVCDKTGISVNKLINLSLWNGFDQASSQLLGKCKNSNKTKA